MLRSDFVIRRRRQGDAGAVARLSARAFGPGRFSRSAYRVREGTAQRTFLGPLNLCAWKGDVLAGAIHFTEICIGGSKNSVLLGPLVIEPNFVGQGCGACLIEEGLKRVEREGYRLVILVGDMTYYERFGFKRCPTDQISLPGPADPSRILVKELNGGFLDNYRGLVRSRPNHIDL